MARTRTTTRTIDITVERDEVRIAKKIYEQRVLWCHQCGSATQAMTPEEVSDVAKVSPPRVLECIGSGELHLVQHTDGLLLICCNFLR